MAGKKITYQRMFLEGFGPYRDAVEVHFQPGTNNLVTANERGKSTLVAGLTAIIFGLPASSDPAKFGLACYRNWENPSACKGALEFTVNHERFLIERDFDSNRISFVKLGSAGEVLKILAEGTHNPNAKKPHPDYPRHLKEIFGLLSRDLFINTFCVTQPLPELKGLSREVQKLLSGGGIDFTGALKALEEELKGWTRFTGDLGVTTRNQQKERELELLEKEIASLQERLAQDRLAVDSLEEVQEELQRVEEQSAQVQEALRSKKKVLEAWTEWKRLQGNYQNAWRDYNRLSRACEDSLKIQTEIDAAGVLLAKEYPELVRSGEETGRQLEELTLLEEKKKAYREDLERQGKLKQQKEAEKVKLVKELADFPRWEELGADPRNQLRNIRKNAAACLQEWATFQGILDKIAELEFVLAAEYALLAEASPEEREVIKNYAKISAEQERTLREAGEKLAQVRAQQENLAQVRRALEEKYHELVPGVFVEETVDGAVENKNEAASQKLERLERENLLVEKTARLKKRLHPSAALRLFFVAIFAAVFALAAATYLPVEDLFLLQIFAILVGGLAGYWGAGLFRGMWRAKDKGELQNTIQELAACREAISALDEKLGDDAFANPAQLGALLEKIKQFLEEKAAWEALENQLPDKAELTGLETDFQQATAAHQSFLERTGKFITAFPDAEEAYRCWEKLLEEKKRYEREAESLAGDNFGCTVQLASGADPAAGETAALWRETVYFLRIFFPEENYATIADLLAFLAEVELAEWEKLEAKAEAYLALLDGRQKLNAELAAAALQSGEQEGHLSALQKKIDGYNEEIQAVLAGANGDLQTARSRWEAFQAIHRELGQKNAVLQAILGQFQVAALEKLREKKSETELHVREHLNRWGEHIEKYPGLPKIEESKDPGEIIKSMDTLVGEVQALEENNTELQKKREEIRMRQLQLQGRDPVNIARAEIELAGLQKKKEEIEMLRDAITVAHAELAAAIASYQDSYLQYLEEQATDYYRQITRNPDRNLTFDANFQLQVKEKGRPCEIAQLSKGAQDQLYLALRFAVADLLAENYKLPFLFDDPFVSSDFGRLENIRELLEGAAAERQFAIFSHNKTFSCWGSPLKIGV